MGEKLEDSVVSEGGEGGQSAPVRGAWGGQLEFILTLVGFAVGLGNVWRFPYLCYQNGGGAFLIPYLLSLVFIGMPIFYLECSLGQFASLGPTTLWKKCSPVFKGLGVGAITVSTFIAIYYQIIVAWSLYFFFASMTTELPWTRCNQTWNTDYCVENYEKGMNLTINKTDMKSPSEEYFYHNVLGISSGLEEIGGVRWQLALILLLSWIIIFLVLLKGIASLGKASYFISLFPYVLLTIMLIRGATLQGASKGIEYYIKPRFDRLLNIECWSSAANQIFYSLGVSLGGLLAMSSFNNFNNNVLRDAILIPIINCGTSIYAGFVIFSVLGYMSFTKDVHIDDVANTGPGLVFVVYPEGLATMPIAPLWSILFFFMMTLLGFSSQFSAIESVITSLVDESPDFLGVGYRPIILRAVYCSLSFLVGLPMTTNGGFYIFKIMDDYSGGYPLLVIGFCQVTAIMYVYGFKRFEEDIKMMIGRGRNYYFLACWVFITPALVLTVTILKLSKESRLVFEGYTFPDWGMGFAWTVAMIPIGLIFLYFTGEVINRAYKGGCERVKEGFRPTADWGPQLAENRTGRYAPRQMLPSISGNVKQATYDNKAYVSDTSLNRVPPYTEHNQNGLDNSLSYQF